LPQADNRARAPISKPRKVSLGSIPDFTFEGDGYRLDGVVADSPAEIAGLKKGDIIVKLDDTEIHGLRDVSAVLKTMKVDQSIVITYLRQGQVGTTLATLKSR
jgi:S1-C subfamily serine protease